MRSFVVWSPLDGIESKIYIDAIHDDFEGFRLLLRGENNSSKVMRILFRDHLFYSNIDEGDMIELLNSKILPSNWSLFEVSSSDLIQWFVRMSAHTYSESELKHYAVYTPNDCVNVLAKSKPEVTWL